MYMMDNTHNIVDSILRAQTGQVRQRTLTGHEKGMSSHVMQYGETNINNDFLVTYLGADPACHNVSMRTSNVYSPEPFIAPTGFVNQRDVHLLHLRHKVIFGLISCSGTYINI